MLRTDIAAAPGVTTTIALTHEGALVTGTTQDCTPILEAATIARNECRSGSGDMRLAASIPFVVLERYMNEHNISWQEFSRSPEHKKRLLNDPDLRGFRVWEGRV